MEPPSLAADVPKRPLPARPARAIRPAARQSFDLRNTLQLRTPDPRSTVACAGLAACAAGLAGVDTGLALLVAGVWTVRAMAGRPVGLAWGVACLGAGLRWGTTSLGDIAVATRLSGPTLLSGSLVVRVGMALALVGALFGEASGDGFQSRTWGERTAAAAAVVALVPVFVVPGPGDPASALPVLWGALAVAGAVGVLAGARLTSRLPGWLPLALAVCGVILASAVK